MMEITLKSGHVILIDDMDLLLMQSCPWTVAKRIIGGNERIMAVRAQYKGKNLSLHREIMNPLPHLVVDHINGNPLDNRRSNLRVCSQTENKRNCRRKASNTSGKKGVIWLKDRSLWAARIRTGSKRIWLGAFKSKDDAHAAYCAGAIKYHGEFARFD